MENRMTIAVLGGTGKEGSGLSLRWACAGHTVLLGSRNLAKARETAEELARNAGGRGRLEVASNADAAARADIVVVTVPYAVQKETVLAVRPQLAGKILVDVTVPLAPPRVDTAQLPGGSAVVQLQTELGPDVKVVSAFQNVSAAHLRDLQHAVDCDVLVCADDEQAREIVVRLAQEAGMKAWHAGRLANSIATEALTSVLIAINKRYKVGASGIRITGVDEPGDRSASESP